MRRLSVRRESWKLAQPFTISRGPTGASSPPIMVCAMGRGDGSESASGLEGLEGGGALSGAGMLESGRTERCAGVEVTSGGFTLPSTTIEALQRRQWILTFLSRRRSSATAYLAGHCPHCTFMGISSGRFDAERAARRSESCRAA